MASFSASSHLLHLSSSAATHRRRNSSIITTTTASRLSLSNSIIQSNLTSLAVSSKNPKPWKSPPLAVKSINVLKFVSLSAASGIAFHSAATLAFGGGSNLKFGGGGGWGGGGGGNGGYGRNFWSSMLLAFAKDNDPQHEWDSHGLPANIVVLLNKLSIFKKYKVSEILFFDRHRGSTVGTEDSFFEMVSLRPGGVYTKAQLQKELETLATCGKFEKVDLQTKTNPDGTINVTIPFLESTWQSANRFRCINVGLISQSKPIEMDSDMTKKERIELMRTQENDYRRRIEKSRPCLLPLSVQWDILQMLRDQGKVSARLLQRIRDRVQQWYHENGYVCAQVVNFGNLHTKEVVCEVVEGDITQLVIQFQDKLGNVCKGNTQFPVIKRELPKQLGQGQIINIEAGKQALRNIYSLALFSNIELNPRPDEKKEDGIIVEIKLKELKQQSAEVSTEWIIVPGRGALIKLGGTVSFEYRNIQGLNRSLLGSVTTSNFLNPQDGLALKLEYVHPYVDGVYSSRNRTFHASCFNNRKLSPVFAGGPGIEVPLIWVDRAGVKANFTENFTRQSKYTYGVVMEQISDTRVGRMAFLQMNITRDNTKFLNGVIVGERDVFQLDSGLGIGRKFSFFNCHQLTVTRFQQLKQVEEGAGKPPPPVLVLHGHYGGCVGDPPSYDAFTLGGPYSVRGYNMGELGAARKLLELAAELRIPVRNTHAYVFAEHGNDLGSSMDVEGNPIEVYRRMGHGSLYGAGVKLGLVCAEYAVNHDTGTGAIFFRFGKRF